MIISIYKDLVIAYYCLCAGIFTFYLWNAVVEEYRYRKDQFKVKVVVHRTFYYWFIAAVRSLPLVNIGIVCIFLFNRIRISQKSKS